jgi:hypothetical protein
MKLVSAALAVTLLLMLSVTAYAAVQFYDGQTNVTVLASANTRCVITSQDGKQMYTAAVTLFYGLVDQTYYPLNLTFGVRNVWTTPVSIVSATVTGQPTYLTVTNNMSQVTTVTPISLQPGAFAHVNVIATFTNASVVTTTAKIAMRLAVNCA